MRAGMMTGVAVAAALAGGVAQAAELEIRNAAARVVVIPEARRDVQVSVTPGAARLPAVQLRRQGAGVEVDGGLRRRIEGCDSNNGVRSVRIRGIGRVRVADLPVITARVPLDAEISADGAVSGTIGRTNSLSLASGGCGDWRAEAVAGPLKAASGGSGDLSIGSSRTAVVSSAGSGDFFLGPVAGQLEARSAGSGDIRVASVGGAVIASSAGSGDLTVESGRVGAVNASSAGSGDIRIDGSASSLQAKLAGSGDIRIGRVLGPIRRSVAGSGDVIIGR